MARRALRSPKILWECRLRLECPNHAAEAGPSEGPVTERERRWSHGLDLLEAASQDALHELPMGLSVPARPSSSLRHGFLIW